MMDITGKLRGFPQIELIGLTPGFWIISLHPPIDVVSTMTGHLTKAIFSSLSPDCQNLVIWQTNRNRLQLTS